MNIKTDKNKTSNVTDVSEGENSVEFSFEGDDKALALLLEETIKNNVSVIGFREKEGNLEEIFMQVTGGNWDDA